MDLAKFYPNERVDLTDMEEIGGRLTFDDVLRRTALMWLPSGKAAGDHNVEARVFDGFDSVGTPVGTATFQLAVGSAITKALVDGVLTHGAVLGNISPAQYSLDFSAAPDGEHLIYARFVHQDAAFGNRIFWNPAGAPAEEFSDSVATREVTTWEAVYRLIGASPPGNGEYFPVWSVTTVSGLITVIDDKRISFFEGNYDDPIVGDKYGFLWGDGANDRSSDRASYGVRNLYEFTELVRRQLSDIIDPVTTGAPHHHEAVTVGLKQLDDEHNTDGTHGDVNADSLDVAGTTTLTGIVDKTVTIDPTNPVENCLVLQPTNTHIDVSDRRTLRVKAGRDAGVTDAFGIDQHGLWSTPRGHYITDCHPIHQDGVTTLSERWEGWSETTSSGSPAFDVIAGWRGQYGLAINAAAASEKGSIHHSLFSKPACHYDDLPSAMVAWYSDPTGTMADGWCSIAFLSSVGGEGVWLRWKGSAENQIEGYYYDGSVGKTVVVASGTPADSILHVGKLVVLSSSKFWFQVSTVSALGVVTTLGSETMTKDVGQATLSSVPCNFSAEVENRAAGLGPICVFHRIHTTSAGLYP